VLISKPDNFTADSVYRYKEFSNALSRLNLVQYIGLFHHVSLFWINCCSLCTCNHLPLSHLY